MAENRSRDTGYLPQKMGGGKKPQMSLKSCGKLCQKKPTKKNTREKGLVF